MNEYRAASCSSTLLHTVIPLGSQSSHNGFLNMSYDAESRLLNAERMAPTSLKGAGGRLWQRSQPDKAWVILFVDVPRPTLLFILRDKCSVSPPPSQWFGFPFSGEYLSAAGAKGDPIMGIGGCQRSMMAGESLLATGSSPSVVILHPDSLARMKQMCCLLKSMQKSEKVKKKCLWVFKSCKNPKMRNKTIIKIGV